MVPQRFVATLISGNCHLVCERRSRPSEGTRTLHPGLCVALTAGSRFRVWGPAPHTPQGNACSPGRHWLAAAARALPGYHVDTVSGLSFRVMFGCFSVPEPGFCGPCLGELLVGPAGASSPVQPLGEGASLLQTRRVPAATSPRPPRRPKSFSRAEFRAPRPPAPRARAPGVAGRPAGPGECPPPPSGSALGSRPLLWQRAGKRAAGPPAAGGPAWPVSVSGGAAVGTSYPPGPVFRVVPLCPVSAPPSHLHPSWDLTLFGSLR